MSRFMSFFGAGIIRDDKEDMVSSEDDRLIPTSKVSLDLTDSGGKFTVVVGKIWGLMLSDESEEGGGTKTGLSGSCKLVVVVVAAAAAAAGAIPETVDGAACEFKTRALTADCCCG